jgi:hypothetical protein
VTMAPGLMVNMAFLPAHLRHAGIRKHGFSQPQ